jgi:hypothetical protein
MGLTATAVPLFYVGWQWVDAKLKVKAADGAQPSKYAASYLRTRMRFTRDSRNGGRVPFPTFHHHTSGLPISDRRSCVVSCRVVSCAACVVPCRVCRALGVERRDTDD